MNILCFKINEYIRWINLSSITLNHYAMKTLVASLCLTFSMFLFASFKPVVPPGTGVGYQDTDPVYYYTFYADLTGTSPYPLTAITVQHKIGGDVLAVESFSGTVVRSVVGRYAINGTATVTFNDGGTIVTKSLTGLIQGGIIP